MKRKTLYAFGLSAVLGFSTLSGCGCGAVQTSELPQQETSTVEEESTSSTETISQEETNSVTETETVETESETTSDVTVTEEAKSSEEIEIIEMDAIMYATTSVNERKEPSADSEKIGSLSIGEEVHVTGQTPDGEWFRIDNSETGDAFVSAQYLSTEKPIIEQTAPEQTTPPEQETVVYEPAPAPEDLPDVSEPDVPLSDEAQDMMDKIEDHNNSGNSLLDIPMSDTGDWSFDGPSTGLDWG